MLKIKFKAWDKKEKQIREVILLETHKERLGDAYQTLWFKEKENCRGHAHLSECELMQYAGYNDIDDAEVYTGCILEIKDYWHSEVHAWEHETVEILEDVREAFIFADCEYIKVIGNVYENEELRQQINKQPF